MSLGLKLYYLRTRLKKVTQTTMARDLSIRQATISNIEQGMSQPSLPLLRMLCRYFDVTPTYLLDEDGTLEVGPADRWTKRHGLATAGHFLEVRDREVQKLNGSDSFLVALQPGTPVYDEEAARLRMQNGSEDLTAAHRSEIQRRQGVEEVLRRELEAERLASRVRRHGGRATEAKQGSSATHR